MMKNALIILLLMFPWQFNAQDFSITDGTISTCLGTLFDSGGTGGAGYSNNESYTVTICPDNANDVITLDFINFALDNTNTATAPANNIDNIIIYDGDNTGATTLGTYTSNQLQGTIVTCTSLNTTGCITLVFNSNDAGTGVFAASITCATPCQRPFAQAISNPDTIAKICIGESVSFDGSSSFAQTGFNIVDYHWDFDDGTIDSLSGATTSYTFNDPGVFNVQLRVIDDNGCINSNLTDLSIWVAPPPVFNPIEYDTSMCIGETVTLTAHPEQYSQTWTAVPDGNLGGPQYVPDQVGQCFTTTLDFTAFTPGQTLGNINDFLDVCINFEHSFMGDLVISLTCPTGQNVVLHQQGGGGTNLGDPDQIGGAQFPGIGWDYCWSPTATNGTWVDNSATNTIVNSSGSTSLIPGTYESINPMNGLVGCDLNGTWEIEFCDLWGADDGFVFSWGINFDPSLFPPLTSFTPSIGTDQDSSSWSGSNIINTSSDGNEIIVAHTTPGSYDYTFSITSDHGCVSDTTITLVVEPAPEVFAGNDTSACTGQQVQLTGEILNTPPPAPPCVFTIDLVDTFGDGWNGASIDVIINGVITNYGMATGANASYTFTLNDGDSWEIIFISGIFDNEIIYTFTDCNGNQIFTDGPNPVIGSAFTSTYGNPVSYTYGWDPATGLTDATIIDPISSISGQTTYVLSVFPTGHPLCVSTDTVVVNINDPSAGQDSTATVCQSGTGLYLYDYLGDSLDIGGTWYNGTTIITDILDPSNLVADTFQYVIGNQGCMDTATVMIYGSIPVPISSNDTSITVDQEIPLWTSGGESYVWTPSIYLDSIYSNSVISTPGEDITYYIEVYDSLGCKAIDTINITVEYNPLFIPNGFSPNNDNNNDVFYVRGGGVALIHFTIFDKWGNLVFESFDMDKGWDGTYNGKLVNTGVYVYRMDATLKNGQPLFQSGNVTLFR